MKLPKQVNVGEAADINRCGVQHPTHAARTRVIDRAYGDVEHIILPHVSHVQTCQDTLQIRLKDGVRLTFCVRKGRAAARRLARNLNAQLRLNAVHHIQSGMWLRTTRNSHSIICAEVGRHI